MVSQSKFLEASLSDKAIHPRDPAALLQAVIAPVEASWGTRDIQVTCLGGDASSRVYHRVQTAHGPHRSLIVMELGPDPLRSEEITTSAPTDLPFFEMQRFLAGGAIPVPEVYAYLQDEGLLLLEDLGDQTLEAEISNASEAARWPLYAQAITLLLRMQRYAEQSERTCACFSRRFDYPLLRWELDHFREWYLEAYMGRQLSTLQLHLLNSQFDTIATRLHELPTTWVHRDYQSRNLMLQRTAGEVNLRVIDFQDALVGPLVYDLVALLRDSYIDLGIPLVERLLALYHQEAGLTISLGDLHQMFWLQTVQRKLKDAGRFVFIDRVKGNPNFMRHIPLSLQYVHEALSRLPEYAPLAELLATCTPNVQHSGSNV